MPAGLRCWDENGLLILDTSTSMFNYLGRVAIGGDSTSNSSGSITDTNLSIIGLGKARFGYFLLVNGYTGSPLNTPTITLSNTNVVWTWPNTDPSPDGTNPSYILIYGVY